MAPTLKDLVSKVAPVLGTALGGPLGGAVISILGEVFGTPHADESVLAMTIRSTDPEIVKANLSRAEASFRAAAEESITLRTQIEQHTELVRLDYDRGLFFALWRPMGGWIATLYAAVTCLIVIRDAWFGTYLFLAQAGNVLMIGGPIMAIAGIYAIGKSNERVALAQGPTMTSNVGDVIKGLVDRVRSK